MARVARLAGQRGRTIPAPRRRVRVPRECLAAAASVAPDVAARCRPGVDTGVGPQPSVVPVGERGRDVRRDSGGDGRGSPGVPRGVQRRRRGRRRGRPSPAAEVAPRAGRRGAGRRRRRRLPGRPARDLRDRRRAGRGHRGRRRRRRRRGRGRRGPGRPGHRVVDAGGPAGVRHQLHPHRDGDERRRRRGGGDRRPSPPSPRRRSPRPSIGPLDGTTVGVGMPIRVYFDDPVADKAAVESHLVVTSSTPDRRRRGTGSATARCTSARRSTGRPTPRSRLDAELYGVDFGEGVWGEKNRTVSFSIGARHVSDRRRRHATSWTSTTATSWCRPSRSAPATRTTRATTAPHVVTEPNRDRIMDSSTYGVPVDSPDGYRTAGRVRRPHLQQRRVRARRPVVGGQQGNANVSHGCINISTERAGWFFDFSQPGDVVEVKNSIGPRLSAPSRHLRLGHPVGRVAGRQRAEVTAVITGPRAAFPAAAWRAPSRSTEGEAPWTPGSSSLLVVVAVVLLALLALAMASARGIAHARKREQAREHLQEAQVRGGPGGEGAGAGRGAGRPRAPRAGRGGGARRARRAGGPRAVARADEDRLDRRAAAGPGPEARARPGTRPDGTADEHQPGTPAARPAASGGATRR